MKNRIFVTLLLSTAIALSAFAQQSSSSAQPAASANQTAPASQSPTATGQEPLRVTYGDFWEGDEPGAAWLIFHPFASKGYVQRHVQPIRNRITELDELNASNARMTRELDSRAQQGIQLASAKTNEADQHALEASNKSQMAQQTASAANTHLSRVEPIVRDIDQYKATTQTEIRFRPGQSVLSKDAKRALDEMATQLKDQHGYVIEVQGFSSGRGQAAIAASRQMADSVVRYLVLNHEIPAFRIYVVGMGNVPAPVTGEKGTAAKRSGGSRVEVSVLKSDLNQLAATSGASTSRK
ncbi:MAG TPA: OmpA family protein [Terriglobales bacterium]|nr:OmpA family protein [Terriglobales bacterium]